MWKSVRLQVQIQHFFLIKGTQIIIKWGGDWQVRIQDSDWQATWMEHDVALHICLRERLTWEYYSGHRSRHIFKGINHLSKYVISPISDFCYNFYNDLIDWNLTTIPTGSTVLPQGQSQQSPYRRRHQLPWIAFQGESNIGEGWRGSLLHQARLQNYQGAITFWNYYFESIFGIKTRRQHQIAGEKAFGVLVTRSNRYLSLFATASQKHPY